MKTITVDEYILDSGQWQIPLNMLRELFLALGMEETIKWGTPVYCVNGKNVLGMASFKSYTGLWFYQGVFLKDKQEKLLNANEDVTRALRQLRFYSADQIEEELDMIIEYVKEAIENSKQGKEIKPKRVIAFIIPDELKEALDNDSHLKLSFENLSQSKKRDFAYYIGRAKRPETRLKRIEKSIPLIKDGKGLMDQYK